MENFKNWQNSGRLYTRKAFLAENPSAVLKGACDDVMVYDGGHYIQGLFDGSWYECNTNWNKDIEIVELEIYFKKVERKLYK
jgi:hypothetical protein